MSRKLVYLAVRQVTSYPAVIELRVDGVTQVNRVLDTIGKLDNALVSIKNTPLAIDAKNAIDGIRVLKTQVTEFAAGLSQGKTQLASTTAGINQQAAALRTLAANAKIGGEAFKTYIQAAEQARQKVSLTGGLAEIAAISSQVKAGRTAPMQSYKGAEELLKLEKSIPKNVASLELFQSELQNTLRYVDIGSKDFNELRAAIDRVGTSLSVAANQARKFGPALPPGFTETGVKPGAFPSSPVSGALNIPGSPKALAEARKRRGEALSNAIIGGAFPLLFGQGPGAAIGGGVGGALGGMAGGQFGFGLSLVGTAFGQAVDTMITSATELGAALEKPTQSFDELAEKSFFSSKALETAIKKSIDYGDTATASALMQEEAFNKLGVDGVENLKRLASESDLLNRAFAELGQQMQAVAAGPLAGIAGFFADVFGQAAAAGRVRLLRSNLNPKQNEQFNKEVVQRLKEQNIQRGFFAPQAPTESEIGMLQQRGVLQDIVDKWQAVEIKGKIKLDPQEQIQSELNALQKTLEVMDIGKQFTQQIRAAAREQQDLDRQRADLVRSYEESIAAIRRQVEDEIQRKRFATLEKENQLLDLQGQNRLKQLQLVNRESIQQAGAGQITEVEQAAKQTAQIVAQFTEQQVSTEEEAAKIKRDAALTALKLDSESAQFKANVEREVSKLNVETARKVADINLQVKRKNEEFDNNRFKLEKRIAELQLKNNEILTKQQLETANKSLEASRQANDPQGVRQAQAFVNIYQAQLDIIKQGQKDIAGIQAPQQLRGVGAVGGGNVSTAGLEKATADYKNAVAVFVQEQLTALDLRVVENVQQFTIEMEKLADSFDAPIKALNEGMVVSEKARTRYAELVRQGIRGVVAERIIEIEKLRDVAVLQYDAAIAELEKKREIGKTNQALEDQIDLLKKRKTAIEGGAAGAIAAVTKQDSPAERLKDAITAARDELNTLADPVNAAVRGANAIGDAFQQAFTGLMTGAMTAQEALASFFRSVGEAFISMAAEIIAKQMVMITLQSILKALGLFSGGGGGGGGEAPIPIPGSVYEVAAEGAYWNGGFQAFANGGMVTSPTMGLIGEGGEPEYVIPASKMRGAMQRYSSGVRGSAVIPSGRENGDGPMGELAAAPGTIDVRYTVERINSVDYVTADQFRAGMQEAAAKGAAQGEQRTLRRLQNSASTRRRIGV